MSPHDPPDSPTPEPTGHTGRAEGKERRRGPGCLVVAVAIYLILLGVSHVVRDRKSVV